MPFRAAPTLTLEKEHQAQARRSVADAAGAKTPKRAIAEAILREGRATRFSAHQESRNEAALDLSRTLGLSHGGYVTLLGTQPPRLTERHLVKASKRLGREYERKLTDEPELPAEQRRARALRRIESDIDRIVATEFWVSTNATREAVAQRAEKLTRRALQRTWNASLDSRTCLVCAGRNGRVTREVPPAHTLCRCWIDFALMPSEQDMLEAQEQLERTRVAQDVLRETRRAQAIGARYYAPDLDRVAKDLEFLHDPLAKAEQIATLGGYEKHEFRILPLSEIEIPAVWQPSKLAPIAQGFRDRTPLPPVHLARDSADGKWRIQDGIHRANQARAAGHTHVPAVTTQWVQVKRRRK